MKNTGTRGRFGKDVIHRVCSGPLSIRDPMPVLAVWFLLLYFDGSGFVMVGVLASLWHELGHILYWLLRFRSLPHITLSLSGIALDLQDETLRGRDWILLAAAGPAMNLLAAILLYRMMETRMTVLTAAYWAANVLVGAFNLLPIPPLDGYRILSAVWKFWLNKLLFRRE